MDVKRIKFPEPTDKVMVMVYANQSAENFSAIVEFPKTKKVVNVHFNLETIIATNNNT